MQRYVGMNVETVMPAEGTELPERYGEERDLYQELRGVYRRGKFMVFMLDDCAILAHNAMSGYWDEVNEPWTFDYVEGRRSSKESDVRVLIELKSNTSGQTHFLQFHDARKFGQLHIVSPEDLAAKLSTIGPEVTSSKHLYEPSSVIDEAGFVELIMKSKKPVKEVLMDQNKIAGLGNIYAAEACWAARTDPFRAGNTMTVGGSAQLYHACVGVLDAALERGLDYGGLKVYRRKTCAMCDPIREIKSAKLKGRTTYWCPSCQK